jgi:hypothetical protein
MGKSITPKRTSRRRTGRLVRQRASETMASGMRAFYAADPRRGPSAERDLGLHWRSATGATYRAAWIADTSELYAVRHSGRAEDARVTVLARLGAEALERCLAGWRRICDSDEPGSYEWLVERATGAWRARTAGF